MVKKIITFEEGDPDITEYANEAARLEIKKLQKRNAELEAENKALKDEYSSLAIGDNYFYEDYDAQVSYLAEVVEKIRTRSNKLSELNDEFHDFWDALDDSKHALAMLGNILKETEALQRDARERTGLEEIKPKKKFATRKKSAKRKAVRKRL